MIINKEELKIVDLFRKNLTSEFTIKEIMQKLGKKSYNWTHTAIAKLSKEILVVEKKGNTTLIKIDIESPTALTHLMYLDRTEAYDRDVPLIGDIIAVCTKRTPFFSLLVAGSYAKGNVRRDSDVDLVMVVQNERVKRNMRRYIVQVTRLSTVDFDVHILTKNEFYMMLVADNENFGKQVYRNHLLFFGGEAYYQIVKEAITDGLQNKI